jgi:hypothetical protein
MTKYYIIFKQIIKQLMNFWLKKLINDIVEFYYGLGLGLGLWLGLGLGLNCHVYNLEYNININININIQFNNSINNISLNSTVKITLVNLSNNNYNNCSTNSINKYMTNSKIHLLNKTIFTGFNHERLIWEIDKISNFNDLNKMIGIYDLSKIIFVKN